MIRTIRILTVAAIGLFALAACNPLEQADRHDAVAAEANAAADRIDAGLARLEPGPGGTPAVPDPAVVRDWLPDAAKPTFDALVTTGRDAVVTAAAIAEQLRVVAAENAASSAAIRAAVADDLDDWQIAQTQTQAIANQINPVIGLAVLGLGWVGTAVRQWKQSKKAAAQAEARGIAEGAAQVARAINAGKVHDDAFRDAFDGPTGAKIKEALSYADPAVRDAVNATKV